MAIESAAFLRRFARTECLVLALMFCLCAAAAAQAPVAPVVAGSVAPVQHDQWGQLYHVVVSSHGDVLFLDTQNGALYQLLPDGKTVTTVSAPGDVLKGGGSFWNAGMAIDSKDTIYITQRYNAPHFFRVPYDPVSKTWPLSAASNWGDLLGGGSGLNTMDIAVDDNDNLVVSTETEGGIVRVPVNADGSPGTLEIVVKGLKARAARIAVDHGGNIFFIEDPWTQRSSVMPGVWIIPPGTTGIVGDGLGSAEAKLSRVDPISAEYNFKGITFDAAGNAYFSSAVDSYGGNFNGVLMVPKADLFDPAHTWNHAVMVSPVGSTAAIAIDRRGYLWIPTGTGGWAASTGSLSMPGTLNIVKYVLGSIDLGATPVGTPGATGTAIYSFSAPTTPASFAFKQVGAGSDFVTVSTDPNDDPNNTTPAVPCTAGTQYAALSSCVLWVAANPHLAGGTSGQLQMLDSNSSDLGSPMYVHGIGQAPAVSILVPSAQSPLGSSSFNSVKQVVVDAAGNIYVADSGAGMVLQYPKGSSQPVSVGTGLTAPTGVAVDGFGNLYIADNGKVLEVPFQSGALNNAAHVTLQSGLGSNLKLAADGAGDVFVADPDNGRVVKVSNTPTSLYLSGLTITAGSGFTAPSAIAVDDAGNLFIADGTSLHEVALIGGQKAITSQLAGSTTGLAVDPSGSVYIASASGLIRIPVDANGALSPNDAVTIAADTITSAGAVAIDNSGNLYASHGSAVSLLSINGLLDFGTVTPYMETDSEAQFFNIGNQPLTFGGWGNDTITGTEAADFLMVPAGDSPNCDPATAVPVGTFCWLGMGVTPTTTGTRTATVNVLSNAVNAPSVALGLTANAVADPRPATTTTVSYLPTQLNYPANVTITATVTAASGTPTGTVIFSVSGQAKVTANLVDGVATATYNQLKGGTYRVTANYGGSGTDFAVSSGTTNFTVNKAASTTTLAIPSTCNVGTTCYVLAGSNFNLTAKVSATAGVPTGNVVFMENGVPADSMQPSSLLDANGVATFNTSKLRKGAHTITAAYQSDMNFAASTSSVGTFQVIDPNILITTDTPSLTLTSGVAGSAMLSLTPLVGFKEGVQLACAGLPNYSECTFGNPTPEVDFGKDPVPVSVTISTNVPVNVAASSTGSSWGFVGMFAVGLVGLVVGKKTKYNGRALMIICVLLLITGAVVGMSACSNSGYTKTPEAPHFTTPSGTYTVGVTAIRPTTGEVVSLPFTMSVKVQ